MNLVPKGIWIEAEFKQVAEVITGTTPSSKKAEYWGGDTPFVGPADLDSTTPITSTKRGLTPEGVLNARALPPESVLVCCIGATVGKVGFAGTRLVSNQQINALVFDPEKVFPRYGFYYCRTLAPMLQSISPSTTLPIVNKGRFQTLKIPVPPLAEQRQIAAILDKADQVRKKRQEAIRLTEEFLRSAFLEMFGDPVTNPKGWPVADVQSVCRRVTDGTHQPPQWVEEGIPFLFVSNIVDGEITFGTKKHISEATWRELTARCPIEVGDILYTTVGSYGNAALVRTRKRFCFQRHIAHIKPDPCRIHPEYMLGVMQSDGVRRQADRYVRGVAQKTLNLRELKRFKITIPPRESQNRYIVLRRGIENSLARQQMASDMNGQLFNSLVQRAFRGEL